MKKANEKGVIMGEPNLFVSPFPNQTTTLKDPAQ
jgi:hypothetical protein